MIYNKKSLYLKHHSDQGGFDFSLNVTYPKQELFCKLSDYFKRQLPPRIYSIQGINRAVDDEMQGLGYLEEAHQLLQFIIEKNASLRLKIEIKIPFSTQITQRDIALCYLIGRLSGFSHWQLNMTSCQKFINEKCDSNTNQKKLNSHLLFNKAMLAIRTRDFTASEQYLQQALTAAVDQNEWWLYRVQLDSLCIALKKYSLIDCTLNIPASISDSLKKKTFVNRAWALTMLRKSAEATEYFELLSNIQTDNKSESNFENHLYLENLRALNQFRLGDLSGALKTELVLNDKLVSHGGSPQLKCLNANNLYRLYMADAQYKKASLWINEAEKWLLGQKLGGLDFLLSYRRACLYEQQGDVDRARQYFVQAILYWLSLPVPEALSVRARQSIVPGLNDYRECPEAVSLCMLDQIRRLFPSPCSSFKAALAEDEALVFYRCSALLDSTIQHYRLEQAAGNFFFSSTDVYEPFYKGKNYDKLRLYFSRLLLTQCPQLQTRCLIAIDDLSPSLIASSGDIHCSLLRWNNRNFENYGVGITFMDAKISAMRQKVLVQLSPCLASFTLVEEEMKFTFKRFLPILSSKDLPVKLFQLLQLTPQYAETLCASLSLDFFDFLNMEKQSLLQLSYQEDN